MIVWNIIRFVCGLPPGEHRDWWGSGVLMNFSLAPDIEMIEYGNFCRIVLIDWLALSQCTLAREKRRWKSHDLQKCNSKIDSFLGKFFTLTGRLYSLDICLYTENLSHQTCKKKTSFTQPLNEYASNHCNQQVRKRQFLSNCCQEWR